MIPITPMPNNSIELNNPHSYGKLVITDILLQRILLSNDGSTFTSVSGPNIYTDGVWSGTNLCLLGSTGSILTSNLSTFGNSGSFPITFDAPSPCVAYATQSGVFVAAGIDTPSGITTIISSSNGITWSSRLYTGNVTINDMVWSPQKGLFVGVASGPTAQKVYTSSNGTAWTSTSSANDADAWYSIAWSPSLSLFAAVGDGLSNEVMTSPTGTGSWTGIDAGSGALRGICWSVEKAMFVAVGTLGTSRVLTSTDGVAWTRRTCPASSWRSVVWSNKLGLFVAISNNAVMTSSNGISWTLGSIASDGNLNSILWIPELLNVT